jgi:hypothetical protein
MRNLQDQDTTVQEAHHLHPTEDPEDQGPEDLGNYRSYICTISYPVFRAEKKRVAAGSSPPGHATCIRLLISYTQGSQYIGMHAFMQIHCTVHYMKCKCGCTH